MFCARTAQDVPIARETLLGNKHSLFGFSIDYLTEKLVNRSSDRSCTKGIYEISLLHVAHGLAMQNRGLQHQSWHFIKKNSIVSGIITVILK